MPCFRCLIRGENFKFEQDGEARLFGFYTTRWVDASDPGEAELAVLAQLKSEPKLNVPERLRNKEARVYFEEIEEVASLPEDPGDGLIFFAMEDSEAADPNSPND